ncbi:hypothetical protein LTR48_000367 [Friedmanniomyces endolithicus]|uniref:Amidohydrolase-related domain-containing protein n=1 Tax=Rachicladosporium monterosium TaxID=1507873 RepID=A0ABR0LGW1_9PEZI|nr:hypothetical protein LTR48_000367 [Friedmanniomyces endolithicus]KAK5148564.1 hypothetical protein LTR32_000161 [Rachicladosporium monterosium]
MAVPFLITDVRVFDGQDVIERGSVLVEKGMISQVSPGRVDFDGLTLPKPGCTLISGLIDVHIHATHGSNLALPQSLRFGVTTVLDMHNEWCRIEKLRRQSMGGGCADLKVAGVAATVEGGWPSPMILLNDDSPQMRQAISEWPNLRTPDEGRQYVQDRLKEGVDYIKLMHESGSFMARDLVKPTIEVQRAITDEAHKAGLLVLAHATSLEDTVEILNCGVDGLTHTFIDRPPTAELISAYKANNAHCNPTLATMASTTAEGRELQVQFAQDARVQSLIGSVERERKCSCTKIAVGQSMTCENAFETVRQMRVAGITVLVYGTPT